MGKTVPIYEYRCVNCGHDKEALIFNGGDVRAIWCDKCGRTMIKIISAPAIVYEMKDDYAQR